MRTTIKIKIFILAFTLTITITFALSYSFFNSFKNLIENEFETKGKLIAENFALNAVEGIIIEDINKISALIQRVSMSQDIVFANVYNKDGDSFIVVKQKLFEGKCENIKDIKVVKLFLGEAKIPTLSFSSPVIDQNHKYIGCIRIVMSLNRVNSKIMNLIFNVFLWIIIAFGIIGGIGSYLIGFKIAAPIHNLTNAIDSFIGAGKEDKIVEDIKSGRFFSEVHINSKDEVGKLSVAFINIMVLLKKTLENLEKEIAERKQAEEMVRKVNEELEVRVQNRTQKLQEAQEQLIHAEKMAALGHLIAGIAHEINTPLGAIRSSIGNISKTLNQTIKEMPAFFRALNEEQVDLFFDLLARALSNTELKTSNEEREIKKVLHHTLEEAGFPEAASLADTLVDMRIYDSPDEFFPLFKSESSYSILNVAYRLSGLQRNSLTIVTATERAARIVYALKNYVYQNMRGNKTQVNIIEELETVLTLYHNKLKHGVEVIRHYSVVPPLMCYQDELNQVWTNLIHNALQAMEYKGMLEIRIYKEDVVKDANIVVQITDNGSGIPEEIKPRIFEPFFTTKKKGEGAGLGLSIVKKIVEKHKGKIEFSSIPCMPCIQSIPCIQGMPCRTTFSVYLPLQPTD